MKRYIIGEMTMDGVYYVHADKSSGGTFSHLTSDWSAATIWQSEEEARRCMELFKHRVWHLYEISPIFLAI